MWWHFYSGLSCKIIDQMLEFCGAPEQSTAKEPTSQQLPAIQPRNLDSMIQNIQDEISALGNLEDEKVRHELSKKLRIESLNDISHDLRTPLNAIIGFTQLMESGIFGPVGNPQYREYLRHIRESGYELLEQVETLINDSHPDNALEHEHRRQSAFQEYVF